MEVPCLKLREMSRENHAAGIGTQWERKGRSRQGGAAAIGWTLPASCCYRRFLPELRERTGEIVNHKRLHRILSEYELALPRSLPTYKPSPVRRLLKEAAGSLNLTRGLDPGPLDVLVTDFTELVYNGGLSKAYLMAVVDLESRCVLGWALGTRANRELALCCWNEVRSQMAEFGCALEGRIIHHDQDSVYTSYQWLRAVLIEDGMRVSYSERGAKDNPHA